MIIRPWPDEATEPDRLDAAARGWLVDFNRKGSDRARLAMLIAGARKAAANLRAMRSARMRYGQPLR